MHPPCNTPRLTAIMLIGTRPKLGAPPSEKLKNQVKERSTRKETVEMFQMLFFCESERHKNNSDKGEQYG